MELEVKDIDGKKTYVGVATAGKIKGVTCVMVCSTKEELNELLYKIDVIGFDEEKYKKVGVIKVD